MTKTIQPHAQVIFSMSEKIDEKTKGEYVEMLDDLCAALEKISTTLAKSKSEMTNHRNRLDMLRLTRQN